MWKLKFPLNIEAHLNSVRLLGCGGMYPAAGRSHLQSVISKSEKRKVETNKLDKYFQINRTNIVKIMWAVVPGGGTASCLHLQKVILFC